MLSVSGNSWLATTTLIGALGITGDTTFTGDLDMSGSSVDVDGTAFTGDSTFTGDVGITGTLTTSNPIRQTINSLNNVAIGNLNTANTTMTGQNNVVIGPASGTALTSGAKNLILSSNAGANITTGIANICLGPLSCESTVSGGNNIHVGYSTGYDHYGVVGIGAHSCAGIYDYGGTYGAYDLNACYGHEAGTPKDYFTAIYFGGEHNLLMGARTGYVGDKEIAGNALIQKSTLLGDGASFGTTSWKYLTSDISRTAGIDTATVNSTAHSFSDEDWIWFRDSMPNSFLNLNATTACALGHDGIFRVNTIDANSFELEWCRSTDGATNYTGYGWSVAMNATAGDTGCSGAPSLEAVIYDAAFAAAIDAIADNTPIKFSADNCGTSLTQDVVYYTCRWKPLAGGAHSSGKLSFKTTPDCAQTVTTGYVNIVTNLYTVNALTLGDQSLGDKVCPAFTRPDFDATYTYSGVTYGFDSECNDVTETNVIKLETTAPDWEYITALGRDVTCGTSNTVCVGRDGIDKVKIGGVLDLPVLSGTQPACAAVADVGNMYVDSDTPGSVSSSLCVCMDDGDATYSFAEIFNGASNCD
jgi:hypothetical protein